jgi:glycosyltransferase involved in cell wall biosynthesis
MTAPSQNCHQSVSYAMHAWHVNVSILSTPMDRLSQDDIVVSDFHSGRRSMRLAVVTETYPPEINGVAMTIAHFVEGLRARGHDLQLVRPRQARGEPSSDADVLIRGLPIPRYPHLKMGLPAQRALLKLWSLKRPDVVHIVTEGPLGWSALRIARKLKLPVTSDFRTNFHAYSSHYGIGWLKKPIFSYLRKFHNGTLCTMVPTAALARDLEGMGFTNLRVVARGVDTARFDPAKRSEALRLSWRASPDAPVAIYVGRLAAEKNLDALVMAWAAMRARRRDMRLVLVGDGPMRNKLEERLPDAIFAGQQRGARLAEYYASADIFLFPSITETFGNVTAEAMASGLTIVAYDYAAAAQLIDDGASGRLVPYDNTKAFVAAASEVVDAWPTTRTLGVNARAAAEELIWERQVEALESVLRAAADSTPSASKLSALSSQRENWAA